MEPLSALGWDAARDAEFASFARDGLVPGRVVAAHGQTCRVATAEGDVFADVAGRLRHAAETASALPATGDWVALRPAVGGGRAAIDSVLDRRSRFSRKAAGSATEEQVVAANVDVVLLVVGLDGDFNLRRVERTLVLAWESGATPVVVLSKADLCPDLAPRRAAVEAIAPGVVVLTVSARTGDGLETLSRFLAPGRTAALLGSSGVGKSTLVNRLLGHERQPTLPVREHDSRGRHATTHRELIALPGGALVVDTPGMRELQLWAEGDGLGGAFEEIEALAASCGFRDCGHRTEPRCAVRSAVDEGRLDAGRFESFLKLRRELRHLEVRRDQLAQLEQKKKWRAIHRAARDHKPRE